MARLAGLFPCARRGLTCKLSGDPEVPAAREWTQWVLTTVNILDVGEESGEREDGAQ